MYALRFAREVLLFFYYHFRFACEGGIFIILCTSQIFLSAPKHTPLWERDFLSSRFGAGFFPLIFVCVFTRWGCNSGSVGDTVHSDESPIYIYERIGRNSIFFQTETGFVRKHLKCILKKQHTDNEICLKTDSHEKNSHINTRAPTRKTNPHTHNSHIHMWKVIICRVSKTSVYVATWIVLSLRIRLFKMIVIRKL